MRGGPEENTKTVEEHVATVAASILGVESLDPDVPLGLDSLGKADLAFALEGSLGVQLEDGEELNTVHEAVARVVALRVRPVRAEASLLDGVGALQPLAKGLVGRLLRWYYRMEIRDQERIPESGAAVLAANHESFWDIPLLVIACPRPIVFMAKEELYRTRLGAWFFTKLGGFRVRRGSSDILAARKALAVVRSGRVLGMYPESTRRVGELLPFFPGAAWVALAEGVPVVPVGIKGTGHSMPKGSKVPRRVQIRIAFGQPIEVTREADPRARLAAAAELTLRLRAEVERLLA